MRRTRLVYENGTRQGWRLRYYGAGATRRTMWLGDIPESGAQAWLQHVEHITACLEEQLPIERPTVLWLRTLPNSQRAKLEVAGLVQPSEASRRRKNDGSPPNTLGPFLEWYIANRSAKPRTVVKWQHGKNCLLRYFRPTRTLDSITHADAEAWRNWLAKYGNVREGKERVGDDGTKTRGRTDLSDATVRRRTGQARQFFNYAVKAKLVESNPFESLPATVYGNEDRKFFVSRDVVERLLEQAPGAEWEAIIALARYGGLRAPSEVMRLKWEDIDFVSRRMCIHSSKTEHHRSKGVRYCPIFPELLPYLENLAELAKHRGAKPTDFVITKPRGSESVLTRPLKRMLKKAGIPIYPKPLQNLRASRETELMDEFPLKDVCSWIGNSPKVAMEHYAMTRQESFQRAAGLVHADGGPKCGPIYGDSGHLPATGESAEAAAKTAFDQGKPRKNAVLATAGNSGQKPLGRPGRT